MKKVALIVAGGKGRRMQSKIPKQFLLLNKLPILMHTICAFSHFEEIVLVLPKAHFNYWEQLCKKHNFNIIHTLIEGGENRFHSVKNGLAKIDGDSIILIHDGVRPLVSKKLIDDLIKKTRKGVGTIPILPVTNSIRKVEGNYSKNVSRNNLYQVQTPQCFLLSDIKPAYNQKYSSHFTDDSSVFESRRLKIKTIMGERRNLKITNQEDLKIAQVFMQ